MRASIVVLTYDQLEDGTKPCLESIFRFTKDEDYELIVVDNASKDGTPAYLNEVARSHFNVRVVLNDSNRGYAGGNNDGIKIAKGEYVILLNNDTLVTPNWLDLLLAPMKDDRSIGLVSPITNSAGNEEMVVIPNLNESNYVELSGQYVNRHKGYFFETEKLGFYCVAISSEAIAKIGLLDEKFGIGMFEDDDYCIRARKAGYRLMVNEGCFIYHKGSLSFKKIVDTEYKETFRRNKAYFTSKHGEEWLFNQITMAFYRQMEHELRNLRESGHCDRPEVERISVRLLGFKFLIENSMNIERNAERSGVDTSKQEPKRDRALRLFRDDFVNGGPEKRRSFIRRCRRKVIPLTEERIIAKFGKVRKNVRFERAIVMTTNRNIDGLDERPSKIANLMAGRKVVVIYQENAGGPHDVEVLKRYFDNVFLVNAQFIGYLPHMATQEETIAFIGSKEESVRAGAFVHDRSWVDISRSEDVASMSLEGPESTLAKASLITVSEPSILSILPEELKGKARFLPDVPSKAQVDEVMARLGVKL